MNTINNIGIHSIGLYHQFLHHGVHSQSKILIYEYSPRCTVKAEGKPRERRLSVLS